MQPDTTITFRQLRIRVAEALGVAYYGSDGTQSAQPPQDLHDLNRVDRAITDGLATFYGAHDWYWLQPVVTVTLSPDGTGLSNIDSDPARYRMPWYVQGPPTGHIKVELEGGGSTYDIPHASLTTVIEETGRTHKVASMPVVAGFGPYVGAGDRASDVRGWEMRVAPKPDRAHKIYAEYRISAPELVIPSQKHVAGSANDSAVIAACLRSAFVGHPDMARFAAYDAEYQQRLGEAIRRDARNRPSNHGSVRGIHSMAVRPMFRDGPIYADGVKING